MHLKTSRYLNWADIYDKRGALQQTSLAGCHFYLPSTVACAKQTTRILPQEACAFSFEGEGDFIKHVPAGGQRLLKPASSHAVSGDTFTRGSLPVEDDVLRGKTSGVHYLSLRGWILDAAGTFLWVALNGGSLFLVDKQWQLQGSHLDPPHRLWRCPGKQHQNGFRQYTHRAVDFWWVKEIVTCVTVVVIAPQFPRCPVLTQLLSSSPPSTIPELYFLIARFLEAGPCQKAAEVGVFAFRDYLEHIRIRHER